jgi:ubiquitin-protein ligase
MSKNKNINTSINADIFNLDDDEENEVIENTIISNDKVSSNGKSSSESVENVFIPKETMERLLKDIKDIYMSSLEEQGIYYKHSDTNILKAYVMIVGQKESLYFGGYYFFEITFPSDYPHAPPLVEYLTNDGITRFHPNFYKSKKVCLSILNTWRGEQWTSCLTIKSILLTLLSIMDNKPMLHEPGITEKHNDYNSYHTMILYKNIDFSCIKLLNDFMNTTIIPFETEYKEYFYKFMIDSFKTNVKNIIDVIINCLKTNKHGKFYSISGMYNMAFFVDFNELLNKLIKEAQKYDIFIDL